MGDGCISGTSSSRDPAAYVMAVCAVEKDVSGERARSRDGSRCPSGSESCMVLAESPLRLLEELGAEERKRIDQIRRQSFM